MCMELHLIQLVFSQLIIQLMKNNVLVFNIALVLINNDSLTTENSLLIKEIYLNMSTISLVL
jgi:hypothetical protein